MRTLLFTLFICLSLISCRKYPVSPSEEASVISYIGRETNEWSLPQYVFEFNTSALTPDMSCMGYSPVSPDFFVEMRNDTGWVTLHPNWCGTGMDWQQVKDMPARFTFRTSYRPESKPWRLGVDFYYKGNSGRERKSVLSGIITE